MKDKSKTSLKLFLIFLKIGAFTFGGGFAMIPLIEREISEKRPYISKSELLDMIAVSESTPGPIAVNIATFIGYRTAGVIGAFAATLGVVLPSFTTILVISFFLKQFESITAIKYAFNGIRIAVLALIIRVLFSMAKQSPKGVLPYAIIAASFVSSAVFNVNAIFIIIASAAIGLAGYLLGIQQSDSDKGGAQ